MTQTSAPLVNSNLSDADWRQLFGAEPGIVGDLDGTAYRLVLPPDSDIAQVGSSTQDSISRVAGFRHTVPSGQSEGLTIPAASGSDRTDLIVNRYDPANTGAPGPVRLAVIAGTGSGLPTYDASPPGIEDMPLWAVTRKPGQALSQATVIDLRTRVAVFRSIPDGAPLPTSSPLETTVRQGLATYRRQLDGTGSPAWVQQTGPRQVLLEDGNSGSSGWIGAGQTAGVITRTVNSPRYATTGFIHLSAMMVAAAGTSVGDVIVSFAGESYAQIFNVDTSGAPVVIGMPVNVPAGASTLQVNVKGALGEACYLSYSSLRVTI